MSQSGVYRLSNFRRAEDTIVILDDRDLENWSVSLPRWELMENVPMSFRHQPSLR